MGLVVIATVWASLVPKPGQCSGNDYVAREGTSH